MGHVDAVAFLKSFMYHYPILMLPVAAATLFNLGGRIMSWCGLSSFVQEDDDTAVSRASCSYSNVPAQLTPRQDMVTEGKSIIRKEKRRWQMGDSDERPTRRVRTFPGTNPQSSDEVDPELDVLGRSLNASPAKGKSSGRGSPVDYRP